MSKNAPDNGKLSVLLRSISVPSVRCAMVYIYGPGGMGMRHGARTQFHYVVSGSATIECGAAAPILEMQTGDFVLFPRSIAHAVLVPPGGPIAEPVFFRDEDDREPMTAPHIRVGDGQGESAVLLSGTFRQEHMARHPLFAALPPVIQLRRQDQAGEPRYFADVELLELRHALYGADHVDLVRRFVDLKVAQIVYANAVRHSVAPPDLSQEWRIAAAQRLMERSPERQWTVADLARQVGMSRSAFSGAFTQNSGKTVISYLRTVRMRRALELIQASSLPIGAISQAVGFDSVVSFTRTFKRFFGASPRSYRGAGGEQESDAPIESCDPFMR